MSAHGLPVKFIHFVTLILGMAMVAVGCDSQQQPYPQDSSPSDIINSVSQNRIDIISDSWRTFIEGDFFAEGEESPQTSIPSSEAWFFRFDPRHPDQKYVGLRSSMFRSSGPPQYQVHIYPTPNDVPPMAPFHAHVRSLQRNGVETNISSIRIDGRHYQIFSEPGAEIYYHLISYQNGLTIHVVTMEEPSESADLGAVITQLSRHMMVAP